MGKFRICFFFVTHPDDLTSKRLRGIVRRSLRYGLPILSLVVGSVVSAPCNSSNEYADYEAPAERRLKTRCEPCSPSRRGDEAQPRGMGLRLRRCTAYFCCRGLRSCQHGEDTDSDTDTDTDTDTDMQTGKQTD